MKSGIYCIKSISQNKIYIGQSVYLQRRKSSHKKDLASGKHGNEILQRHYDKYGKDDLIFEIIEFCEIDQLDARERYWISYYDSMNRSKGFNMESGGNLGKAFSDERRLSITGEGNPMYGRKHSPDFVEYIRIRNRASSDKLTTADVEDIKKRLVNAERQQDLAKEYNVTISTINKIAKCKNWEWVLPELNQLLINASDVYKENRDNQFNEYFSKGLSVAEIAIITGCQHLTITNVLKKSIDEKRNNWKQLKENVLHDYRLGLSRNDLINKYGISKTTHCRIISDEFNKQKDELKDKIVSLKKSGMLNKDIAIKLGIHRTTVTQYLKKHAPELIKR